MEKKLLTEYYNNIAAYLTQTFGADFILIIIVLTTTASIAYFIMISYLITQLDTRYFLRKEISDNKIKKSLTINITNPVT